MVGRSDLSDGPGSAMGLAAVHAIADHTDGNPARDPDLTTRVLRELGATMPLEGVRETPSPHRPGVS